MMRLVKAGVQNFRSIVDSGEFEIEKLKTILAGPPMKILNIDREVKNVFGEFLNFDNGLVVNITV
jgi:hypothetical protein